MPNDLTLLNVFVSSPGDLSEERRRLHEIVDRINRTDGKARRIRLELWLWEDDVLPAIGAAPQEVINRQLPEYDIYLGMLAGRFGTPTSKYGSGTEEEFHDALQRLKEKRLKWILFYFRQGISPSGLDDLDQYKRVLEFKQQLSSLGVYRDYKDVNDYLRCVEDDLRRIIADWQLAQRAPAEPVAQRDAGASDNTGPPMDAPTQEQFGYFQPTTALNERDEIIDAARRSVFDVTLPAYLLDSSFHFLDWNTAFDELVAKPLKLNRRDHALEFVQALANCGEVIERSKRRLGYNKLNPIIDVEPLVFQSPTLGLIQFQKVAAQIIDLHGNPLAWSVTLNIESAEQSNRLWRVLEERITDEYNWTRYAVSYDKLLVPFQAYNAMLDKAVGMIGAAKTCIDLGSGTGNGTFRLLESNPERIVWAVDSNEGMLQYLRTKAYERSQDDQTLLNRLTTIKGNVMRLTSLKDQNEYFDAALMINVLYAVEDPVACLKRTAQLLKPAGVLVLTTPHKETDVKKLFRAMRRDLTDQGLFAGLSDNYDEAKLAHKRMDHLIHRDSIEELHRYFDEAGFDIEHEEPEYVDSVMLFKALKREDW